MEIEINYNKSVGVNAKDKYLLRNKYKKKIEGLEKAYKKSEKELYNLEHNIKKEQEKTSFEKIERKEKKWYHKFRYTFSENNYLIVCGKDARNNEQLIKKHMDENDLYFHADISGAAHTLLKNPENQEIPEEDKLTAANMAAIYSSAFKSKIYSVDVYSVNPEQVTKTANTGEALGTGAFVIRGKRGYYRKNLLELAVGYSKKYGLICGPTKAIKKHCSIYYCLIPGR